MSNVQKFELAVLRPLKGKMAKPVFTRTVFAETITDAVKQVRNEVEGSGWVVLQSSQVQRGEEELEGTLAAALRKAYERKYA